MLAGAAAHGGCVDCGGGDEGMEGHSRPSVRRSQRSWLYRFAKDGHGGIPCAGSKCSDHRGRERLAIQPSRAGGAYNTSRAYPYSGELERAVAGVGGNAEPERFANQGERFVQYLVERIVRRCVLSKRAGRVATNGESYS